MNLTEIGSRIKAERKRRSISQEKLAEMINVTPHYIYEIERGLKAMSLETLANMSEAMGLSADFILFGDSQKKNVGLFELLEEMDDSQRERAESAFKKLLPYIK